jgi:signal transduction histidine kinase
MTILAVAASFILVISIVFIVRFSTTFVEPLRTMILFSKKVASGDFEGRLSESNIPEIDRLVEHLNHMTEGLQERDKELLSQREELAKANEELQKSLEELSSTQTMLVDASRRAGMAEIATGVLHNVGNVLNSVNVSAQLASDKLRGSELSGLRKAVDLLVSQGSDLGSFLTQDQRGEKMLRYLVKISEHLEGEHTALGREIELMEDGIQHIKTIVSKQQDCARSSGVIEKCTPTQLVDEAAQLALTSYSTHEIDFVRDEDVSVEVLVDRHRVLQILVNLLNNAKHALRVLESLKKEIRIGITLSSDECFRIRVSDTGIGIPKENLSKIFIHGFSTKENGHGFGLHDSANAAIAMGGRLSCESVGEGRGAVFTLELPIRPKPAPT